ncbi:MAG: trigger factor [Chloroflexi bacterium]|nr:trigger factor [Chloroflexota bacterium]
MNIQTEHTTNAQAIVTVEVDEERVQEAMRTTAQRISRARPVPGFRPGKAPYDLIERTYGKEHLRDEAIEEVAQAVYKQVLRDEKILAYAAGQLEVQQKEPLILRYTIPTRPVVTLGDYRSLHLQPQPVVISEDLVNETIERLQREHAQIAPVERPAQLGDIVTLDLAGGFPDQPPIDSKGVDVTVEKEGNGFPWAEQLVGAVAGETRAISHTFSADDVPDLASKTAQYTANILDIKERQLPPLDDDLAKMVGKFDTFDQLKFSVRNSLREQKQVEEENRFADEVIDAIVSRSQVVFPEVMVNDQVDQDISREQALARQLGLTWDKYLQLAGKTGETMRLDAKPRAEKKIQRLLTILELVQAENITTTPDELNAEIDRQVAFAVQDGSNEAQVRRQYHTPAARRDLELNLKMRKAMDRVVAMAKGEPISGKILTPAMLAEEQRARERAAAQAGTAAPGGLITDPAQARSQDWRASPQKLFVPGKDK